MTLLISSTYWPQRSLPPSIPASIQDTSGCRLARRPRRQSRWWQDGKVSESDSTNAVWGSLWIAWLFLAILLRSTTIIQGFLPRHRITRVSYQGIGVSVRGFLLGGGFALWIVLWLFEGVEVKKQLKRTKVEIYTSWKKSVEICLPSTVGRSPDFWGRTRVHIHTLPETNRKSPWKSMVGRRFSF